MTEQWQAGHDTSAVLQLTHARPGRVRATPGTRDKEAGIQSIHRHGNHYFATKGLSDLVNPKTPG